MHFVLRTKTLRPLTIVSTQALFRALRTICSLLRDRRSDNQMSVGMPKRRVAPRATFTVIAASLCEMRYEGRDAHTPFARALLNGNKRSNRDFGKELARGVAGQPNAAMGGGIIWDHSFVHPEIKATEAHEVR